MIYSIKNIYSLLLFVCTMHSLYTQQRPSSPPLPGPAPEISIGRFERFTLANGLNVFVVSNKKVAHISYTLSFNYIPPLEKEFTGLASFTEQLIGTATGKRSKDEIDKQVDFIGATLESSDRTIFTQALSRHKQVLIELLAEVVLNPLFTDYELEKIKKRNITAYYGYINDPEYIASQIEKKLLYGDTHPYGEIPTPTTMSKITVEKCRTFYQNYYQPQIATLSIIGNITAEEAYWLTEKYFSSWQQGSLTTHEYPPPTGPVVNTYVIADRPEAVQSVIKICYPLQFLINTNDYHHAILMNHLLGSDFARLFNNLREKHAYTYGAYSNLVPDPLCGYFEAYTSVSNKNTAAAIKEILFEMRRLKDDTVEEKELFVTKNKLSGHFALSLENPETIAHFALNTHRYMLPEDFYVNYLKQIEVITPHDILRAASNYIHPENSYIIIVGHAEEITPQIEAIPGKKKILYYDLNTNTFK